MGIQAIKSSSEKISLWSLTALCVSSMIGSGWMFAPALAAHVSGNHAFAGWIIAAIVMVILTLSYIPAMHKNPVHGLTSRCVSLSHGGILGLPFAYANLLAFLIAIPTEAQASAQYLAGMVTDHYRWTASELFWCEKIVATVILFVYLGMNYFGIKWLARFNNPITILKVVTPVLIVIGLLAAHFDKTNFIITQSNSFEVTSIFSAIVGAGMLYCLAGAQMAANLYAEVENPNRNIPLAIIISLVFTAAIFIFVQFGFMGSVPQSMLSHGWGGLNFHSPLLQLTMLFGLNIFSAILVVDSVVSPGAAGIPVLGNSGRMVYGMAEGGHIPKIFASKIHPKYHISRRSMGVCFLIALISLWSMGGWDVIMHAVSFFLIMGYMAGPVSMGVISRRYRWLGGVVFVLVAALLLSVPKQNIAEGSIIFAVLFVLYGILRLRGGMSLQHVLLPVLPLIVFLVAACSVSNIWVMLIFSIIIYMVLTSKKFVDYCLAHAKEAPSNSIMS